MRDPPGFQRPVVSFCHNRQLLFRPFRMDIAFILLQMGNILYNLKIILFDL